MRERNEEGQYEGIMREALRKYREGGKNVIIFRNGVSADLGTWEREENFDVFGRRYNAYVGASGTWKLKSDGGWKNWAFCGRYTRDDKCVHFH